MSECFSCFLSSHPPFEWLWQHFGIVPIEAMYAERPVIACNSGNFVLSSSFCEGKASYPIPNFWCLGGPLESIADGATGYLREPSVCYFFAIILLILLCFCLFLLTPFPYHACCVKDIEFSDVMGKLAVDPSLARQLGMTLVWRNVYLYEVPFPEWESRNSECELFFSISQGRQVDKE